MRELGVCYLRSTRPALLEAEKACPSNDLCSCIRYRRGWPVQTTWYKHCGWHQEEAHALLQRAPLAWL
jgi:hypothetical protein